MNTVIALGFFLLSVSRGQELTDPPAIVSENGALQTSLSLDPTTITIPNTETTITTRLFNGLFPGPTFRLQPGDVFQVDFTNNLADQGVSYQHNTFSAPDETNIHFHGLHVSGELPSDDTTHIVRPGENFAYSTTLPTDHMPGTHWLHPHRHGATSLQAGGGAVCAIIVEDVPGTLSAQVENAREVLFLAQQIDFDELREVADQSDDNLLAISGETNSRFVTVNGQVNPVISVTAGEWIRMRIIWAAWLQGTLDFSVSNCEMQLLAKDGIYIRDFPREIQSAPIVAGGRADIMVRCLTPSSTFNINGEGGVIATIQTTTDPVEASTELEAWTPTYPDYLSDLRSATVTSGCSCDTQLGGNAVNGNPFSDEEILHETSLGSIIERNIRAGNHPYHQHVYPYQLFSSSLSGNNGYNTVGDWHDTFQGTGAVRYQTTVFTGKVMVHCHRLKHEDQGMMGIEIVNPANSACICGETAGLATWIIIVIVIGGLLIVGTIIFFVVRRIRRRRKSTKSGYISAPGTPVEAISQNSP